MDSRVRIIGGRWKRSKLAVPALEGLRPTPDRVRESLFNWLGQDLTGWACLDLFAGTGVLGFEAASRGAARVTLVEQAPALVKSMQATKARLGADAVTVVRADVGEWLASSPPQAHDLILADPPYRQGWLERLLPLLRGRLAPGGRIYVESEIRVSGEWLQARGVDWLEPLRAGRAGQVHYHLLGNGDAR
jgi:16S rRNA (guanine(966)-N(2))-methyltransferase RsmD